MSGTLTLLLSTLGGLFALAAREAQGSGTLLRGEPGAVAARSAGTQSDAPPDRSVLAAPLYLGDAPPECRTLEVLELRFGDNTGRTRDEALGLARRLRDGLTAADAFRAVAAEYSSAPSARLGAVLGTFPPGLLAPAYERFLWSAEEGAVSEPLVEAERVLLLRRGERWAGCRLVLVDGEQGGMRARAAAVRARLAAGEPFSAVARECSDDEASARRGGDYAVFERGPQDRLLKRAVFEAAPGELVGPLSTPLGLVVAQRVAPEELPPELWENGWGRVRALLVSHRAAPGPVELSTRTPAEARALVDELARRVREDGADLAALAAEYDDDPGGRVRRGDLGWVRRDGPTTEGELRRAFEVPVGELVGPLAHPRGFLLLRREER